MDLAVDPKKKEVGKYNLKKKQFTWLKENEKNVFWT